MSDTILQTKTIMMIGGVKGVKRRTRREINEILRVTPFTDRDLRGHDLVSSSYDHEGCRDGLCELCERNVMRRNLVVSMGKNGGVATKLEDSMVFH